MDPVDAAEQRARLGRGLYGLGWLLVTVAQLVAFVQLQRGIGWSPAWAAATASVVGQVLKVPITRRRLAAMGRPGEDALYLAVPLLNLALVVQLLRRTPHASVRARRVRSWATQTSALGAYRAAVPWMGATVGWGLGLAAAAGVLQGAGSEALLGAVTGDDAVRLARVGQVGGGLAVLTGLYTLFQIPKTGRASRGSWWPSLLFLPAVALALASWAAGFVGPSQRAIVLVLVELGWVLGGGAVIGGTAAVVWLVAVRRAHEGISEGSVLGEARSRWAELVVAWGVRHQIVQVGGQIVVPGVWFGISYAFADLVALYAPERPMLKQSVALTRGIRSKLFLVLLLWFAGGSALQAATILALVPPDVAFASLFDPSALPAHVLYVEGIGPWLVTWWTAVAMWVLYRERSALWEAKHGGAEAASDGESSPA